MPKRRACMHEFYSPTKIIFGEGCASETAPRLREMGATKVLIVTGKSSTASSEGFRDLCKGLDAAGIQWVHFAEVSADPETSTVDKGAEVYRANDCNAIIGFGGGSPIDCAKGIAASIGEGRPIRDFVGTGLAFTKPVPPLVAIPTTAGTGTEVTNAAVFTIVDEHGHRSKKGTSSQFYFPRLAIVDPLLHMRMPPSLTAATGMDALTHAIEAFVSRFHTPVSDMYCMEAVRRIGRSLRAACRVGSDSGTGDGAFGAGRGLKASGSSSGDRALLEARSDMALAATLAGVGLSQAGLGMVHGFAHPVGAMAGLAHGLANAEITFDLLVDTANRHDFAMLVHGAGDGDTLRQWQTGNGGQQRIELGAGSRIAFDAMIFLLKHQRGIERQRRQFGKARGQPTFQYK
ncbi:MAG: hypothetical protein CVV27_19300 [Candidatus Melainabacteria bacterium HGW-Melainabacteria-1]|nr:MAG: hypothetical protein CVV27_19300 [Candidatus Melainabacteria bacterium HGW-Melainabacteria-1]